MPASGKDGISPGLNIRDLIHTLDEYQDGRHSRGAATLSGDMSPPTATERRAGEDWGGYPQRSKQTDSATQARQAGGRSPQQVRPYQRKPRQFFTEGRGKCRSIKLLLFNRSAIIRINPPIFQINYLIRRQRLFASPQRPKNRPTTQREACAVPPILSGVGSFGFWGIGGIWGGSVRLRDNGG